jgi:hypothetical protein
LCASGLQIAATDTGHAREAEDEWAGQCRSRVTGY